MRLCGRLAAQKALRRAEIDKKLMEKAMSSLFSWPCKARVPTRIAKRILLKHPTITVAGVLHDTLTKSIGAGVHEVYIKSTNP